LQMPWLLVFVETILWWKFVLK